MLGAKWAGAGVDPGRLLWQCVVAWGVRVAGTVPLQLPVSQKALQVKPSPRPVQQRHSGSAAAMGGGVGHQPFADSVRGRQIKRQGAISGE